jgi:hypothetical protein
MAVKERVMAPPTEFIPMQFVVDVEIREASPGIGLRIGDVGRGQVAINDRTFILKQITHQIVRGWPEVPDNVWAAQDGFYRIDWSEYEQVRFFKGVIPMADIAFGSVRDGNWIPLPAPVTLPGNQTLHLAIQNEANRDGTFLPKWQNMIVEVIFHGIQKRGSISQTSGPGPAPELEP